MRLVGGVLRYPETGSDTDCYLFTANSEIDKDGCLVMGRGCALLVRDKYQGVNKEFGSLIRNLSVFNLKIIKYGGISIGAFQTKIRWKSLSALAVVEKSVIALKRQAMANPQITYHLPMPAVSNGGMRRSSVLRLVRKLPDNVLIYSGVQYV